jgi:hypothetical protein
MSNASDARLSRRTTLACEDSFIPNCLASEWSAQRRILGSWTCVARGSRSTLAKITRLMSDQLEIVLVLWKWSMESNLGQFDLPFFVLLSDLPMRLESCSWVVLNLSQVCNMWRSPWRDTTFDDRSCIAVILFETNTHGENASLSSSLFSLKPTYLIVIQAHIPDTSLSRAQYRAWYTHTITVLRLLGF